MEKIHCKNGLRWFQTHADAVRLGKVFFVFNPNKYSYCRENLTQANILIKKALHLWKIHGIHTQKELYAVDNLERQYYNNQRRIFHLEVVGQKQINSLTRAFRKLTISH